MEQSFASPSLKFTVILEPQPEGGFTVRVPALPGVITEADTKAEALEMAEEAIRIVLEHRRNHEIEISADITPTLHTVTVAT